MQIPSLVVIGLAAISASAQHVFTEPRECLNICQARCTSMDCSFPGCYCDQPTTSKCAKPCLTGLKLRECIVTEGCTWQGDCTAFCAIERLGDGVCDPQCNSEICDKDAGDCDSVSGVGLNPFPENSRCLYNGKTSTAYYTVLPDVQTEEECKLGCDGVSCKGVEFLTLKGKPVCRHWKYLPTSSNYLLGSQCYVVYE